MYGFAKIQSLDKILIKKANKLYKKHISICYSSYSNYLINKGDNMEKQRPPPKLQILKIELTLLSFN